MMKRISASACVRDYNTPGMIVQRVRPYAFLHTTKCDNPNARSGVASKK